MRKIFFLLPMFLILFSCNKYANIDERVNKMTPPVTLVSRSEPRQDGTRLFKLRDAKGRTFTSRDNSLYSVLPGQQVIPSTSKGTTFKEVDKVLMKLHSPVMVIGKDGISIKFKDAKGTIVTVHDRTLEYLQVGDMFK
jgi:hypothetical protein